MPADLSQPLAANEHSLHFGKGQTETSLTLPPGKHTLQLVLGRFAAHAARSGGDLEEDHHYVEK